MIPQTTELSQIQAAFIDKDNRIEELMRQINSAQSLLNSLKDTMNSLVGDGKITIQTYAGSNVGDFTVNQKEDKTIKLPQQATVNNGKLTIQKNGTSVGTFTANQSGNTTANITVPTKTSEITNNSNFISDANYVHTDNNFTNADKAEIGKINNSLQFTYVIDNDQKLNDWANNVAGNDYTSVLIRGERTLTAGTFNLSTIGTKVIVGEAGSKIYCTLGSFINRNPNDTDDQYYYNVTFEQNKGTVSGYCICFRNLKNMYNCTAIGRGAGTIQCFETCSNLIGCKSYAYATSTNTSTFAFKSCSYLTNCYGYSSKQQTYLQCKYLNNCNGKTDTYHAFYSCEYLNNCEGKADIYHAFYSCNYMNGCVGDSRSSTAYRCQIMSHCYMTASESNAICECQDVDSCVGIITGTLVAAAPGFNGCNRVRYCHATQGVFYNSYSSQAANATYACANTLNGGWNTTV